MKTVILCGGLGTRLSEETTLKPKPMVEIGDRPILWHIMKIYDSFGFSDFVLALGYKGSVIKDYFINYHSRQSDLSVNLSNGHVNYSNETSEKWKINLIDTGANTMTGGRLLRLRDHLIGSGTFMVTYGDGLGNIDIGSLLNFHRSHGRIATVTSVRPPARFGGMDIQDGCVLNFEEKPQTGEGWINGGFFVFDEKIFDYLSDDHTVLEKDPMENLVKDNQLMAYEHRGYWQCMDTVRDRDSLNKLWASDSPPWVC